MNPAVEHKLGQLKRAYDIIDIISLDPWHDLPVYQQSQWLEKQLYSVYRTQYTGKQRIVFTLTRGDLYDTEDSIAGGLITTLFEKLNSVDISSVFIILVTTDREFIPQACQWAQQHISKDETSVDCICVGQESSVKKLQPKMASVDYNSIKPLTVDLDQLTERQQYLLTKSKTFCMYPWIHLHAYPTGQAHVCCQAEMAHPIGDCRTNTLDKIWNDAPMRSVRQKMLSDQPVDACVRCYEQEQMGFLTGRMSANKHHGHHIGKVDATDAQGRVDQFAMTYWDIRFSNLCNLSCRSCGHIFSSSWYKDQTALSGPQWAMQNKPLNYAGRYATDIYEQLLEHIDYVEQIYFAGGEPLMMEEHYLILEELERRGRFNVKLVYNTNFTQTKLKDREVFDYWRKFKNVSVGASLDGMHAHGEYIRKGTDWQQIEHNRATMMSVCPNVDFYISPTLSIMNALHLPDFHRDWVTRGLLRPQDLNINILQDPAHFRIDIALPEYKQLIETKFQQHLDWLRPLDHLKRATVGFESAINFMQATDNTHLIQKFWTKTLELDSIRKENILQAIPELAALK